MSPAKSAGPLLQRQSLNTEQCFWRLNDRRMCPTHTIAGMFEIYEQLLPRRLYAIHKTQASPNSDPTWRLCGTAPESLAHILSACPALAQTKYLARHDAVLKVLFFDFMEDLGLIEASPPWYSPTILSTLYQIACAPTQKPYGIGPLFTKGSLISARFLQRSDAAPLRSWKWIVTYGIGFRTTLWHRVNRFRTAAVVNNSKWGLDSTIWRPCHLCWFLRSRTL